MRQATLVHGGARPKSSSFGPLRCCRISPETCRPGGVLVTCFHNRSSPLFISTRRLNDDSQKNLQVNRHAGNAWRGAVPFGSAGSGPLLSTGLRWGLRRELVRRRRLLPFMPTVSLRQMWRRLLQQQLWIRLRDGWMRRGRWLRHSSHDDEPRWNDRSSAARRNYGPAARARACSRAEYLSRSSESESPRGADSSSQHGTLQRASQPVGPGAFFYIGIARQRGR